MWSWTEIVIGPNSWSFTLAASKAWQKNGEPKTGFAPWSTSILYVPGRKENLIVSKNILSPNNKIFFNPTDAIRCKFGE